MKYQLNEILIVTFNRNSEYKVASEGPTNPFESDSHDEPLRKDYTSSVNPSIENLWGHEELSR